MVQDWSLDFLHVPIYLVFMQRLMNSIFPCPLFFLKKSGTAMNIFVLKLEMCHYDTDAPIRSHYMIEQVSVRMGCTRRDGMYGQG